MQNWKQRKRASSYEWEKKAILDFLREDWASPVEISTALNIPLDTVKKVLKEAEEDGLVFRDGPLYIHRLGRA